MSQRDDPMVGRAVVRCPGCGQERWHGYGNCSNCGAAGTAVDDWAALEESDPDATRIAELEADLAARSHEAVEARGRAEVAEGLLRRLVADVVYVHDGTVSDCTGIKAIHLEPEDAAQLDRIINTKESE